MSAWKRYNFKPQTPTPNPQPPTPKPHQERFAATGGARGSTKSHSKHFHLKLLVPQTFMIRMLPVCRLFDFDQLKSSAEPIQYQFGRECKPWSHIRSVLFAEAGETDAPAVADPPSPPFGAKTSRNGEGGADEEGHASKRSRGNELSGEDQEGFAEACGRVAEFFSGGVFPRIPRGALAGLSESVAAAACAHVIMTKTIAFPFHRQFTSDSDVNAMITRLRSCSHTRLLRDEAFDCREMDGSPLRVHTKFKASAAAAARFMIFKPNDPSDFQGMDRVTDVFVEASRLLSFRCDV